MDAGEHVRGRSKGGKTVNPEIARNAASSSSYHGELELVLDSPTDDHSLMSFGEFHCFSSTSRDLVIDQLSVSLLTSS